MKMKLISRILAICGLVCVFAFTICLCISLFTMNNEEISSVTGPLTLVLFVATLIFFIPAYVLGKRVREDEEAAERAEEEADGEEPSGPAADVDAFAEASLPAGETDDGESRADDRADDINGGKGKQ